jgi:HEAT repeat protein
MTISTPGGLPGAPPETDDSDRELKGLLSQFTLTFLKALMMTGIYPPDHPAIADVSGEPFLLLKRLAPSANEITYMSASAAIGDEIMVEGVLSDGIPFQTLLQSSMGEVFARKFVAYFERNQLVSFSVKTRISKEEFLNLISVFAEFRSRDEETGGAHSVSFGDLLIQRGIIHVTAMSRLEMVGGERTLPWRVKLAISRMRKDLRLVPLYSEATAQELASAKRMLVQDITRPLRRPQFLKELLANADLIAEGLGTFTEPDIQQEIVWGLHTGMLVNISWDIVADLERAAWGVIRQQIGDLERRLDRIFKNLLKIIALRLREQEPEAVKGLLQHLFEKQILQYKELPAAIRKEMLIDKWTVQFLANSKPAIERFDALSNDKLYCDYLGTFMEVFPELLRRGEFFQANRLARTVFNHATTPMKDYSDRQDRAQQALKRFATVPALECLTKLVDTDEKEQRKCAFETLDMLGESSLTPMLKLLEESNLAQVRRDLVSAIEQRGEDAHVPLMEIVASKGKQWYVYRNAILLLARTGCLPAVDDVRSYLSHPHNRVREEAIQTLVTLVGKDVEGDLVSMTRDRNPQVARKAVQSLSRLNSRTPPFLAALTNLVRKKKDSDAPVAEELQLAAIQAVAEIGVFTTGKEDIRQVLLDRLGQPKSFLKKLLKSQKSVEGEQVRAAVCRTLGAIGNRSIAVGIKERLANESSALVKMKAKEAIALLTKK